MISHVLTFDDFLNESNIGSSKWTESEYDELKNLQLTNLKELISILKKHKTRYWIDCGTLLGIYRDKSLINGDSDCDIGIFAEDITADLVEDLRDRLYVPNKMFYQTDELIKNLDADEFVKAKNLKFVMYDGNKRKMFKNVDVSCDIFLYFPNSDYRMFKYGSGSRFIRTRSEYVEKLGDVQFKGNALKTPSSIDKYLEQLYGKGWKTPDPSFDYSKDDPWCLIDSKELKGTYYYNFKTKKHEIK